MKAAKAHCRQKSNDYNRLYKLRDVKLASGTLCMDVPLCPQKTDNLRSTPDGDFTYKSLLNDDIFC